MRAVVVLGILLMGGAHEPSINVSASKFVPGVTWRPNSVLNADFTCRVREEQAILGVTPTEIVVAANRFS